MKMSRAEPVNGSCESPWGRTVLTVDKRDQERSSPTANVSAIC